MPAPAARAPRPRGPVAPNTVSTLLASQAARSVCMSAVNAPPARSLAAVVKRSVANTHRPCAVTYDLESSQTSRLPPATTGSASMTTATAQPYVDLGSSRSSQLVARACHGSGIRTCAMTRLANPGAGEKCGSDASAWNSERHSSTSLSHREQLITCDATTAWSAGESDPSA